MTKFNELKIESTIIKALKEQKIEEPTEIQAKTIPLIIEGKDVMAGSATGSGKTLAFGAGLIQNFSKGKGIQGLVLTPTRELAEQIRISLKNFSKYKPLNIAVIYGGVAINPQIQQLKNADLVIATPGRMLDHINRKTINLSKLKTVVLDEADRMVDMGFVEDVERILNACPKNRQTLLYSATISTETARIAKKYMNNPIKVSVECHVDPKKLKQIYYGVKDNLKFSLFVHLLKEEKSKLVMVFCNSRRNTDFVAENLKNLGIDATAIHGGLTQFKRNSIMKKFNTQKVNVLVCTDVAARGLDIQGVSHVYNYDLPNDSKQYVHRIGRTARAGKEGIAINVLSSRDHENFDRILRDYDLSIKKMVTPRVEKVRIKIIHSKKRRPQENFRKPDFKREGFDRRQYEANPRSRSTNSIWGS